MGGGVVQLNGLAVSSDVGRVGWSACSFVWLWRVSAFDCVGVCLCYWIDTGCLCLSSWFFVFCPSMRMSVCVRVCMVTGHGRVWWNCFAPPHWLESCRTSWYWLESEWWRWALRTVPLPSALQTLICHGAFDHRIPPLDPQSQEKAFSTFFVEMDDFGAGEMTGFDLYSVTRQYIISDNYLPCQMKINLNGLCWLWV